MFRARVMLREWMMARWANLAGSLLMALACAPLACAATDHTIDADGMTRRYHEHLPAGYDATLRTPVIMVLHDAGQTWSEAEKLIGADQFADAHRLIAVYPEGLHGRWHASVDGAATDRGHVDDAAFLFALLDELERKHKLDILRIWVIGMGEGGFMAFRLGCDHPERITASVAIAASMPVAVRDHCRPARPMHILEFNGTADPIMPYDGGTTRGRYKVAVLSANDSIKIWATLDGCRTGPAIEAVTDTGAGGIVRRTAYSDCGEDMNVMLYTVVGLAHSWPGADSRSAGQSGAGPRANDLLWDFFKISALPMAPH
jgi:polyhydroxybutyrate depolymerase